MKEKHRTKNSITYYLVIFAHFILFITLTILSRFIPFFEGIGGTIIMILIICSLEFFSVFLNKNPINIFGIITIAVFCLLIAIFSLLSIRRVSPVVFWIYAFIGSLVNIFVYVKKKEWNIVVIITLGFSYLITLLPVLNIKTINPFPFWIPSLIVCLVIFIPVLLYSIISYKKKKKLEHLICIPLIALFCGFFMTWSTLGTMNYCLDYSTPKQEAFIITDKKVISGARTITSYDVYVKNSNTSFSISIDETSYNNYEIGDEIVLSLYSGAFNEAYYIYEG
ncbi:MAG: hypothetical protein ACI4MN_03960 [Candidatus Coproplasma sp.]